MSSTLMPSSECILLVKHRWISGHFRCTVICALRTPVLLVSQAQMVSSSGHVKVFHQAKMSGFPVLMYACLPAFAADKLASRNSSEYPPHRHTFANCNNPYFI